MIMLEPPRLLLGKSLIPLHGDQQRRDHDSLHLPMHVRRPDLLVANLLGLGNRPFKPRRDGTWTSPVPMTRSMLHRQRTEFWETAPQYDGLTETWNTLRVAVELSHQNDLITAQAVLNSAGITIPTGDLGQGCYDELGHRFVLPDFVLSEPSNIVADDVELKPRDSSSTAIMKHEIEGIETPDETEAKYSVTRNINHLLTIGEMQNVHNGKRC